MAPLILTPIRALGAVRSRTLLLELRTSERTAFLGIRNRWIYILHDLKHPKTMKIMLYQCRNYIINQYILSLLGWYDTFRTESVHFCAYELSN